MVARRIGVSVVAVADRLVDALRSEPPTFVRLAVAHGPDGAFVLLADGARAGGYLIAGDAALRLRHGSIREGTTTWTRWASWRRVRCTGSAPPRRVWRK